MKTFREWLAKKDEMAIGASVDAILNGCKGGPDYQVLGACSDLRPDPKEKKKKKKNGRKKTK
jgi:hypothetical protein